MTIAASALTSDRTHLPAASFSRVTGKTRERAAERGEALDDGSFPIRDGADLKRAINAFGRAKDKAKAKRHIIKRARALDKIDLLPETWRETASKEFQPKGEVAESVAVLAALRAKVDAHNALTAGAFPVTAGKLRCVYDRGLLAGGKNGLSAEQCAMARVNAFLLALRSEQALTASGVFPDADLLPRRALVAAPGNNYQEWEHPRDKFGKWIEKGGRVKVSRGGSSSKESGVVVANTPNGVNVRFDDGREELISPDEIEASQGVARLNAPVNAPQTPAAANPKGSMQGRELDMTVRIAAEREAMDAERDNKPMSDLSDDALIMAGESFRDGFERGDPFGYFEGKLAEVRAERANRGWQPDPPARTQAPPPKSPPLPVYHRTGQDLTPEEYKAGRDEFFEKYEAPAAEWSDEALIVGSDYIANMDSEAPSAENSEKRREVDAEMRRRRIVT